jgi:hypothetical protein
MSFKRLYRAKVSRSNNLLREELKLKNNQLTKQKEEVTNEGIMLSTQSLLD